MLKVLYCGAGPDVLKLVREISVDGGQRGSFLGTGDGATAIHAGRSGPAKGTITVEDATTAQSICSAAKATATFACVGDTGNVNVTVTGLVATGYKLRIGDGSKDSEPVAPFEVSFIADSVAVAAA